MNTYTATLRLGGRQYQATRQGSPQFTATLGGGGGGSHAATFSAQAGAALSAGRVVKVASGVATYWSPGDALGPVGVTVTAAGTGEQVTIQTSGHLVSPGWNLTPGRCFATANGVISPTPATSKVQPIGEAIAADTLVIQFFPSITTL